uniref:AsmA family protein n=1 Tax=Castellaniella defragrans TaxID=75697 RepID=UPI00333EBC80
MHVWLKRVVFGLVFVVIAATVGLAIFLLTFNPNAYKDKLQELVYAHYQRTLTIGGDIGLSLFPRIGLSVRDVALSNRGSKDIFVSIDSARFAVAIWPLLSNQLVVDHVAVSGLKAWVTRDAEGRFNFSDLVDSEPVVAALPAAGTAAAPAALAAGVRRADLDIDIAGLELKDGQVHYLDESNGMSATATGIEAVTGRVTYDQPFDVSIKGDLVGQSPVLDAHFEAQALLRLNSAARGYGAQKINVQLTGRVDDLDKAAAGLKGNLAYSGTERLFSAGNLELTVSGDMLGAHPVSGLKITLSAPQIRLDQRNTELQIDKLALRASGKGERGDMELVFDAPALAISPESAQGDPVTGTVKVTGADKLALTFGLEGLSGNANELRLRAMTLDGGITRGDRLTRLQLASPATWDRSLRKGSLSAIKGDLSILDPASQAPAFEFPMIGSVHLDQIRDTLDADINAVIEGGQFSFKSQTQRLADPQTQFSLTADKLDLNRWLAPKADAAKAPEDAAAAPAPADGEEAAAVSAASQQPAPAPAAQAPAGGRINWSVLEGQDIAGTVKIDDLRVRDVQLRSLSADVAVQKDKLEVSKLTANLYEGTLSGGFSATAAQALAAQLTLDKVAVEPFLRALTGQGQLAGTAGTRIDVRAHGDTTDAVLRSLEGRATWQVRDGVVYGIDVSQSIEDASAVLHSVLNGQPGAALSSPFQAGRRTAFSAFDGRIDFQQGQGKVSKLSLVSDLIRVTEGQPAQIDLPGQQMDLVLNAQITSRPPRALAEAIRPLLGATLPVRISGPFDHLAYDVQWSSVRNQAIRDALKSGLMDLLQGEIIPAPSGTPAAPSTPAAPANAPDPVKRIGEALKGLLGQ